MSEKIRTHDLTLLEFIQTLPDVEKEMSQMSGAQLTLTWAFAERVMRCHKAEEMKRFRQKILDRKKVRDEVTGEPIWLD